MSKLDPYLEVGDVAVSGFGALSGIDANDRAVAVPRMSFYSRADLAAAVLPYGTPGVYVERYTAGGPLVGMFYSLNNSSQISSDPTSMAVTVKQADGTTTTKYTKLKNSRVTPAMMGALYDGVNDDAPAIQNCLTYFGAVYADGKSYDAFLKTPIKMGSHQKIDMRGGGWWFVDALNSFTNAVYTMARYGDTAAIVQAYGTRSGSDVPLTDISIKGIKFDHKVRTDGRNLLAISAINVQGFEVSECEFTGWAAGCFVALNSMSGRTKLPDNWMHHTYSNFAWASNIDAQMTGIEVDGDRVFGKSSSQIIIARNFMDTFAKGATAITAGAGYQCDGVTFGASGATYSQITDNFFNAIDEAVDCAAAYNLIAGNIIVAPTGAAVKLPHGASYNHVTGNQVKGATLWCVCIAAGSEGSCLGNRISGNRFHMETGPHDAATPTFIYISDHDGTYIANGNVFQDNTFDSDGTVPYFVDCRTAGGKNKSIGDNVPRDPTDSVGFIHASTTDAGGAASENTFEILRPVNRTRARASLSGNFTKNGLAAEETLPFDTVGWDDRSEINTTTHKITVKMPGWYRIKAELVGVNWPANNRAVLTFRAVNSAMGGSFTIANQRRTWTSANASDDIQFSEEVYLNSNTDIWAGLSFAAGATTTIGAASYLEVEKL